MLLPKNNVRADDEWAGKTALLIIFNLDVYKSIVMCYDLCQSAFCFCMQFCHYHFK